MNIPTTMPVDNAAPRCNTPPLLVGCAPPAHFPKRGLSMRLRLAVCLGFLLFTVSVSAVPGDRSPDGVWMEVDRAALGDVGRPLPTEFRAYRLNLEALKKILA